MVPLMDLLPGLSLRNRGLVSIAELIRQCFDHNIKPEFARDRIAPRGADYSHVIDISQERILLYVGLTRGTCFVERWSSRDHRLCDP